MYLIVLSPKDSKKLNKGIDDTDDFRKENFYEAICEFQHRERRFGK